MKIPTLITLVKFLCLCFCFNLLTVQAQMRVGQPAGSPDPSAALDVSGGPYSSGSSYRGILPPKVALTKTSSAIPVTSPATGLLIYNTAKDGDVTPGYYYWEGSKWVRLSTTATGAGRVAAVTAGAPVPEYTLAQAQSLTTAPGNYTDVSPQVFMLVEEGKEGLFRYDFGLTYSDPTHPELYPKNDGAIVIVTAGRSIRGDRTTYKRVYDREINVKWFGAKGDGRTDDSKAIQDAVDYARSKDQLNAQLPLYAGGGGRYRATVLIPEGNYLVQKAIDITNANGLIIKGVGGSYINTTIVGITGSIIFDFTGSNLSGCENLHFTSGTDWNNPNSPIPIASTIGVQFALSEDANHKQIGGLNCTIKNCYFEMANMPTVNNGLGTIGIVNCRSEEFSVRDCLIKANTGCVFSYKDTLTAAGYNMIIKSPYATVATKTAFDGSMGVVNFVGHNSIQNLGKTQPALILNGTNSVNFNGYLGRSSSAVGDGNNEAAILATRSTKNFNFSGTVESFSQLLRIKKEFQNCTINAVVANQVNNTSLFPTGTTRHPIINVTGAGIIQGCKINVSFGNGLAEVGGRYLLYEEGISGAQLLNNEIICSEWPDNSFVVSANLLGNSENTSFKTAQPFEKKSVAMMNAVVNAQNFSTVGWTANTYNQIVPVGTLSPSKLYVMKVIWNHSGVDQVVQSYIFAMSGTDYNGTPTLPVLTPGSTISWANSTRSINIRYKAPTVGGQTSYGLEAKINSADMNNGTLTITIAPLL